MIVQSLFLGGLATSGRAEYTTDTREPVQRTNVTLARPPAERWSRDVSEEIADDLAMHLAIEGKETPVALESLLDRHGGMQVQLPFPLRSAAKADPQVAF